LAALWDSVPKNKFEQPQNTVPRAAKELPMSATASTGRPEATEVVHAFKGEARKFEPFEQDKGAHKKVVEIFLQCDVNRDGKLQPHEIEGVLEKIGMGRAAAKKLVDAADVDGDGQINYEEFVKMMMAK